MDASMEIFRLTRLFPPEERFALTDQIRRSSRAVCAILAEAWRKRRYRKHFISKLTDATAEAEETRVGLEYGHRCGYLDATTYRQLDERYDAILAPFVHMIQHSGQWTIRAP